MQIRPPVLQLALDYAKVPDAIDMAKIGIEAGFDWLEAFETIHSGAIAKAVLQP